MACGSIQQSGMVTEQALPVALGAILGKWVLPRPGRAAAFPRAACGMAAGLREMLTVPLRRGQRRFPAGAARGSRYAGQ